MWYLYGIHGIFLIVFKASKWQITTAKTSLGQRWQSHIQGSSTTLAWANRSHAGYLLGQGPLQTAALNSGGSNRIYESCLQNFLDGSLSWQKTHTRDGKWNNVHTSSVSWMDLTHRSVQTSPSLVTHQGVCPRLPEEHLRYRFWWGRDCAEAGRARGAFVSSADHFQAAATHPNSGCKGCSKPLLKPQWWLDGCHNSQKVWHKKQRGITIMSPANWRGPR